MFVTKSMILQCNTVKKQYCLLSVETHLTPKRLKLRTCYATSGAGVGTWRQ